MDDEVAGLSERAGAQLGEVGGFGVVGAQEAVVALDRAFLPGVVGVAVVDGDAEEGFERVLVEELGAVVGEQGLEFVAVGAEVAAETAERGGHGVLGERREGVQVEAAGFRGGGVVGVDECQEAVAAVGGVDGVHLEVAGLGVVPRGGGEVVDQVLGGVVAGWVGGGLAASPLPVTPVGERFAVFAQELAAAHEAVDGAEAGDVVVVRGLAEGFQRVGDALLRGILFREGAHEAVGDPAAGAFVRGTPAGLLRGEGRA